jgi:xylulokinase
MYLLGYDLGSSSIKAAIVDATTRKVLAVESYPEGGTEMDMISRQNGWAEQQPDDWWRNLCIVTKRLLKKTGVAPTDIQSIGIAYQMHGLVLVDNENRALRPSIIWCDSRAVSIGNQAFKQIGEQYCLEHLLNSPGNFTAAKLRWVQDNEPEIYSKIHKIMLPGDYIAMRLTGEAYTTVAGLTEGIFWDFKGNCVSQKVMNHFGFSKDILPEIVPTFSNQGTLSREAAEATGLHEGIRVTYRAGDQPNNALSLNVLHPGEVAATSGTSGVVYGIVDRPLTDMKGRINSFAHVNHHEKQARVGVLLCLNGAGIQHSWMKHQVARDNSSYADMERMLSSVPVGSDGLCILPFGNGAERMLENRNLNSHIFNLQFNRHTRAHLFRAGMEGVAFSFVYGINILKELGLEVDVLRVGNDNMFQSQVFSSTIATLLGAQIEVVETTGAVGAALASGIATGTFSNLDEALKGINPTVIHEPQMNFGQCTQAYNLWLSCLEQTLMDPHTNKSVQADKARLASQKLREDLATKERHLNNSSLYLLAKDEMLSVLKADMQNIVKENDIAKMQIALKKLVVRIDENINKKGSWQQFEQQFDLLHSQFIQRLHEKYPILTTTDLKLSALLRMRLNTKEIAGLLNLSPRGVETQRYRLRKKFNLAGDADITNFLEEQERQLF